MKVQKGKKCHASRSLILTHHLGCNASIPSGYLMCDLPFAREEHKDSSVEVSMMDWNILRNECYSPRPPFAGNIFTFPGGLSKAERARLQEILPTPSMGIDERLQN